MPPSPNDFKLAGVAAGFTLGFGFLTVWNAIKQTRAHPSPHRSLYLIMVWGEILVNVAIGIIAWLFLEQVIPLGVPVLFIILFLWAFEIHFLVQILVNRLLIVAANKSRVAAIRWWTAASVTLINIAVFCIWIPAHLDPPPFPSLVTVNNYWDRSSKFLILLIDAALNIWFTQNVKRRLIKHYGLSKYTPLFRFNMCLIVLSICLDGLIIGLMSLPNQLVYIQFHPVVYMAKLNIELAMAEHLKHAARTPVVGNAAVVQDSTAPLYLSTASSAHNVYLLGDRKKSAGETEIPATHIPQHTDGRIRKTTDIDIHIE